MLHSGIITREFGWQRMTNALITLALCLLLMPLLLWLIGRALSATKDKKPEKNKSKPKAGMPHGDDQ